MSIKTAPGAQTTIFSVGAFWPQTRKISDVILLFISFLAQTVQTNISKKTVIIKTWSGSLDTSRRRAMDIFFSNRGSGSCISS